MDNEFEKKYYDLVDKVRKMRGHQKEYFKYRASSDLQKAKYHERQVDTVIEDAVKLQKSGQQEIFK
jgi:hypothetical protein